MEDIFLPIIICSYQLIEKMKLFRNAIIFVIVLLFLDQLLKIWIKTHLMLGEEFDVIGNWFKIHFIENNGMAFGMELSGSFGKMILSIFRIVAVFFIGAYLYRLCVKKAPMGVILSISLIFAGALGNILDSAFYGLIFNESNYKVASLFPQEGGYASFLHGKVVDMFYFPLIEGDFPSWLPIWGNEHFIFFRPVFNLADSFITVGVFIIILFQRNYFLVNKLPNN